MTMNSEIDWWRDKHAELDDLSRTLLDSIATLGVERTSMAELASRLERSRTGLFKRYASRGAIFSEAHAHLVRTLDLRCEGAWRSPTRRAQFDFIWAEVLEFLTTKRGDAFLRLRAAVLALQLNHDPQRDELELLPCLTSWLSTAFADAQPRAHAVWWLMLAAAHHPIGSDTQLALRAHAWQLVDAPDLENEHLAVAAQLDAAEPVLLGELLTNARTPAAPPSP